MSFVKSVEVRWENVDDPSAHPYDVPAIAAMSAPLRLDRRVTFFVGDNGSGKSTLLEAMAVNLGLNPEGGTRDMRFSTRGSTTSDLYRHIRVSKSHHRPTTTFFLRAESYFNVASAVEAFGVEHAYGGSPHATSHGESFLDLVRHRFSDRGLYLLDEPESALSIHGELQLLAAIDQLGTRGSQFVVATHSPVLMAAPGATIYEFDADGPRPVDWADVDAVTITRRFLDAPETVLGPLLDDDES